MKKTLLFILACFSLGRISAQEADRHALETDIQHTIQKVYAATVRLTNYDSIRQRPMSGAFSGVVVSADGYILTAAHACSPGKVYKVEFTDGKSYIGIGEGRIESLDVAVMKITSPGEFPHADMGWSGALQKGQPCISIAHPASLERELEPVVRFGYIGEVRADNGYIRSTCLMEPGDSGGPLFDLLGRVIGIHSRIDKPLSSNFEIPVDHFRKYWSGLTIAREYNDLDMLATEEIGNDTLTSRIAFYKKTSFSDLESNMEKISFAMSSTVEGVAQNALATLVSIDGDKKNVYFISKSSLTGEDPVITLDGKETKKAEIVARDERTDLVMLKLTGKHGDLAKRGVHINAIGEDTVNLQQLGTFLISPDPRNDGEISVLGSRQFDLKSRYNTGYLGVMTEDYTGGVRLRNVNFNTPASKANLAKGDVILSINGTGFDGMQQFASALSSYRPGTKVLLAGKRADSSYTVSVELGLRPDMGTHIADYFDDGKSKRRDDLKHIFVHDAKLKPAECGGPVFDMEGHFRGINIARFSRTSTVAIAPAEVKAFALKAVNGE